MSIVAHIYRFVIGVDTHARNHVFAIVDAVTGEQIDNRSFPTTGPGITRALKWAGARTGAVDGVLFVIEGVASYGAILAGTAAAAGYRVVEAARMDARDRHGVGKSDPIDSARIARAVLGTDTDQLRTPRLDDGVRAALQVLLTARDAMCGEKTRAINALTALVRAHDLGIDARHPLSADQIGRIARFHRRDEPIATDTARTEATRLARRVSELTALITVNAARLTDLVKISPAAPLLAETGIGPVVAATCLAAYSHPGRVRDEAAFAALAGVNPIPASSGNTVRNRLNRGGDRRLNRVLYTAALTRMTHDETTRAYVDKRRKQGKTIKEIRRCLKRYIARQIYRILNQAKPAASAA